MNRFSDRRIWPQKSHGLWIFAVNRADWRILKRLWIVDQLQFLARIPDCACLTLGSWVRMLLLLEMHCVIVIKYAAFFTIWTKLTVAFTCTNLLLNLYTSVSGCVCGFGFEQKFWRIDGFGAKKARIGGFAYLYSPPSLKCNKLAINVRKTNYVIFRPSQRKVN